jgi:peptidoglycan-associated lipoprotein
MNKLNASLRCLALVLSLIVMVSASSCGKKQVEDAGPTSDAIDNTMGDSDSGKAMGLQTIHFPYDSSSLDSDAKSALKNNAQILKDKGSAKVQIEGHCDERGGIQYNIALGEKRAGSVKKYLVDLGVAGDRIATISFGKERPIAQGSTEEAHGKNRRANFVITAR